MDTIFFLVPLLITFLSCDANTLVRNVRQSDDDYDLLTGYYMGECTFYGDFTTDCSGRLTCRPSDVEDRPTTSELNRLCPKTSGLKSGRWDRDQVIPSSMISRDAGSGRIAKCQFYANRGSGSFKCTGVNADTWKGTFSGSLNSAFRLGLSSSYGSYGSGDDGYGSSRGRDYGSGSRYSDYTTTERYSYSGSRYGDNDVDTRYQTTYRGSSRDHDDYSSRGTSSEDVIMCTYMNDGKGTCRDCTERSERRETSSEIRTTKHYTCSGPETRATWTENNGIMPRGIRPDPYAYTRKVQATCIYRTSPKKFECHGSSNDGNCADSHGSSYGSSSYGSGTTSRCLGGEKWTGTYTGSVY